MSVFNLSSGVSVFNTIVYYWRSWWARTQIFERQFLRCSNFAFLRMRIQFHNWSPINIHTHVSLSVLVYICMCCHAYAPCMPEGYQRELTYRHNDGSYSAFGNSDPEGSIWLTAFVVRSFARAQPYIYIDSKDLVSSIEWIKAQQQENGCFRPVSFEFQFHSFIRYFVAWFFYNWQTLFVIEARRDRSTEASSRTCRLIIGLCHEKNWKELTWRSHITETILNRTLLL